MMTQQIANRLKAFIRENSNGGCRCISQGDACECLLCDVDRLAEQLVTPPSDTPAIEDIITHLFTENDTVAIVSYPAPDGSTTLYRIEDEIEDYLTDGHETWQDAVRGTARQWLLNWEGGPTIIRCREFGYEVQGQRYFLEESDQEGVLCNSHHAAKRAVEEIHVAALRKKGE